MRFAKDIHDEYIDIIFDGVKSSEMNRLIKDILQIKQAELINSHIYTESQGDFEYSDDLDLNDIFSRKNSNCGLYVKRLKIVHVFYEVVVVIYPGYVECEFSEDLYHVGWTKEIADWLNELCSKGIIESASIGYEYDDEPFVVVMAERSTKWTTE